MMVKIFGFAGRNAYFPKFRLALRRDFSEASNSASWKSGQSVSVK
jgi:hypothetical protein